MNDIIRFVDAEQGEVVESLSSDGKTPSGRLYRVKDFVGGIRLCYDLDFGEKTLLVRMPPFTPGILRADLPLDD